MIRVRVQNQLRVGQILREDEGIDRVDINVLVPSTTSVGFATGGTYGGQPCPSIRTSMRLDGANYGCLFELPM